MVAPLRNPEHTVPDTTTPDGDLALKPVLKVSLSEQANGLYPVICTSVYPLSCRTFVALGWSVHPAAIKKASRKKILCFIEVSFSDMSEVVIIFH